MSAESAVLGGNTTVKVAPDVLSEPKSRTQIAVPPYYQNKVVPPESQDVALTPPPLFSI